MIAQNIWNDFKHEIFGFIKARIKDVEAAEDILQDVFVKIHLNAKSLNENDKLTSWAYQITRNTIIDYYRKKKIINYPEDFKRNFPEDVYDTNNDFIVCLKPFINHLPEIYKDALYKTTYENMSQKEYAHEMNFSYSATKSRIQRARQKLRNLFVDCCSVQSDKYGNIISAKSKSSKNCKC